MDKFKNEEPDRCLYDVLGVEKSSSRSEIRSAYRKLAMKWHPDKCSTPEQAKIKFQGIQDAYSVLSDDTKRALYDSGLYNRGDDEGMQSFMSEMVSMMSTSSKSSFGELKDMFDQMVDSYSCSSDSGSQACSSSSGTASHSSFSSHSNANPFESSPRLFQSFCVGRQQVADSMKPYESSVLGRFTAQSFCMGRQIDEEETRAKPYESSSDRMLFGRFSAESFCMGKQEQDTKQQKQQKHKKHRRRKAPYDQGTLA